MKEFRIHTFRDHPYICAFVAGLLSMSWVGCTSVTTAGGSAIAIAKRLVELHCKVPLSVRLRERKLIAQAIHPNGIQINCAVDNP